MTTEQPIVVQTMMIAPPPPLSKRTPCKTQPPAWKRSLATRVKELKDRVEWMEPLSA